MKKISNQFIVNGKVSKKETRGFDAKTLCRFSLALNRTEKKDEETIRHSGFLEFEAWRSGSEEAFAEITVGTDITVEAYARPKTYTDSNGKVHNTIVFVVNKFYLTPEVEEK